MPTWPERSTAIFLFAGAQVAFALCLFYCDWRVARMLIARRPT
jgi:hypothetical protein